MRIFIGSIIREENNMFPFPFESSLFDVKRTSLETDDEEETDADTKYQYNYYLDIDTESHSCEKALRIICDAYIKWYEMVFKYIDAGFIKNPSDTNPGEINKIIRRFYKDNGIVVGDLNIDVGTGRYSEKFNFHIYCADDRWSIDLVEK